MTFLFCVFLLTSPELKWEISFEDVDVFPSWSECNDYNRIAVSDSGNVLIGDPQNIQLALFGADGKLLKKLSQKGEGPGEFSRIGNAAWISEKKVFYVKKVDEARISVWSEEGEYIDEIPYDLPDFGSVSRSEKIHFHDAGNILFLNDIVGNKGSTPEVIGGNISTGEHKALYRLAALEQDSGFHDMSQDTHWVTLWDPNFRVGFGKKFFVSNYSNRNVFNVCDIVTGKVINTFQLKVPAVPLSSESRENVVESMSKYGPRLLNFARKNTSKPDFWPYFNKILVDDEDQIWVSECRDKATDTTRVHVLDSTGKEVATHKVDGVIVSIKNKKLYVLSQDADENIFLKCFTL